ncbi:MAG: hypothetical protein U9O94_08620 [Nanoarchaeota archaeon]|nr:hypothetical protein [Nanoarchaeota archaeon]
MAENDIYNSEKRYEFFRENFRYLMGSQDETEKVDNSKCKYYCRNSKNVDYFERMFEVYETKDLSYVRRIRLNMTFKLILAGTEKDLSSIDSEEDRREVDKIFAFMHQHYKSPKSKSDFIRDLKHIWKILFPEKDERGRTDETLVPYVVRHLNAKMDKSKEKRKKDKLTFEEFEKLVRYFGNDAQMQFYLMFANESLVRPQEACYLRIGDVELFDNYGKIYLSEHGKEGIRGFLRCIDSFPYLTEWLKKHPYKVDKDAFLFVMEGRKEE